MSESEFETCPYCGYELDDESIICSGGYYISNWCEKCGTLYIREMKEKDKVFTTKLYDIMKRNYPELLKQILDEVTK